PHSRRDEPGPRGQGAGEELPRGPLLPAERRRGRAAAAPRAPRGPPTPHRALLARGRGALGAAAADAAPERTGTFREAKQRTIERFERAFIADALARHHGNVSKAADEMGMYRQHLQVKLAELGIDPEPCRRR